jgi:replicative DNA helicase
MTAQYSVELVETEETTRSMPYNIQAEQRLLGSILANNEVLNRVSEFLKPEHFYEPINKKIFNSINLIIEKGISATPVSLYNMFSGDEQFRALGGDEYLNKLAILATTVINPYDYGRIIYDLSLRRDLISIGEEMVTTAYTSGLDNSAVEQIEEAENKLFHLASEGVSERGFIKIEDTIASSITSIDRAMKSEDHITGVTTGYMDLDAKLSGFHNSDLVILAGRPSMGKTALAINLAVNACKALYEKNNGQKDAPMPSIGVFSLEMSSEQLSTRMLSMYTNIDSSSLRSGKVNEQHYNELRSQAHILSELPFFIDDTPALSISAIRTRARRLKRKHNLAVLFIDYLQLIRGSGTSSENRVQEVSEITQGLKALAKELDIPIIAASQLSRAVEQRDDKRPMLSDLRESGSIEQDADIVMFIYREEYYLSRRQPAPGTDKHVEWLEMLNKVHNLAEIIIAKHRNGPVGTVQLYYDNRYSKFKDYTLGV